MAKFIEGFAATLEVPAGAKDVQVFDDELPGFGIRKFRKGGKKGTPLDQPCRSGPSSFFVKFNVGKQQRRKTLGRVVKGNTKAMRVEASTILAKAHLGIDVVADAIAAAEKAAATATLGELVPKYLKAKEGEVRERSLADMTRYLTKTWKPLHDRNIDSIKRKDIAAILDDMDGKVAADRARTALSGLFGWEIERGHVEANATLNIAARSTNGARSRVLSEAELVEIWHACGNDDFGKIVKLLILTGQRRSEIGGLRWSEIPDRLRQIELPGQRVKNHRAHIVPLSDEALALLPERSEGREVLFGRSADGFLGWHAPKQALDARIAKARGRKAKPMEHWTLHDLRRTFVTHIAENGFAQPYVIEAIVNHVSGAKSSVAGVYNWATYLAEKRKALELWGAHIARLVSRPTAKPAKAKETAADGASVTAA
jgi:integrase